MTTFRRRFGRRAPLAAAALALVVAASAVQGTFASDDNDKIGKGDGHGSGGHNHEVEGAELPAEPEPARRVKPVKNQPPDLIPATAVAEVDPIWMKVLVLAATGNEPELGAITAQLDQLGTPYEVMSMSPVPSDPSTDRLASKLSDLPLSTAINGFYQGVILTDSQLAYDTGSGYYSALTPTEWNSLHAFENKWQIREVDWNGWPSADQGFGAVVGSQCTGNIAGNNPLCSNPPIPARYTSGAASVFGSYANLGATVPITNSWVNLAPALTDGNSTPLLTDPNGNSLALLRNHRAADGSLARESIAMTFANNKNELSSAVLGYGLVNWVTKGMFLGERHVYMGPQVDDNFISGDVWEVGTRCGTNFDTLRPYRLTGADWNTFVGWQRAKRSDAVTADLEVAMAFNGIGTSAAWYQDHLASRPIASESTDTLLPAVNATQGDFEWISHTWSHQNLDYKEYPKPPVGTPFSMTTQDVLNELTPNHDLATTLPLSRYSRTDLVTPEISGLRNPAAMTALVQHGVRYIVSDTSRGGDEANPSPNVGNPNPLQPSVLMIPRRPTNLYYNVSTPGEWLAEDNCLYPTGANGHVDSYDALLEREATVLAGHMFRGDIDPWMFHANNLRAYDGTHSLLGDLLDRVLTKYRTYFTLPVQTLTMDELGQSMAARALFEASGAWGKFVPTETGPGAITIGAVAAATVPVTGLLGATGETYGGQLIARVPLAAGQEVTFNGPASPTKTITVTPTSLTFASQTVNTTSTAQAVTVRNTGTGAVAISSVATSGANAADYTTTNGCPASLAAGATCTVSVTFRPTTTGTRTASLSISSDAQGSPHAVSLTGTGAAATAVRTINVSPSGLTFTSQTVNTTSPAQPVTVTNTGNSAVSIASVIVGGPQSADFPATNGCPASLAVGASCTVSVSFKPLAAGARSAWLTVTSDASGSPHTISLSGTGTAAVAAARVTPTSWNFGSVRHDNTSAAKTFTVSNAGTASMTVSVTKAGTNPGQFTLTSACPGTLAAGASCTFSVVFAPTSKGVKSATIRIATNAPEQTLSVAISGTGT